MYSLMLFRFRRCRVYSLMLFGPGHYTPTDLVCAVYESQHKLDTIDHSFSISPCMARFLSARE